MKHLECALAMKGVDTVKLREQAIAMHEAIRALQISSQKKDDQVDEALLRQDELQAKLDTAALFLNCVKNKGHIFFSNSYYCEICWQNFQEVVLNCKHGICINCVVEFIVLGQPTDFEDEINSSDEIRALEYYMACPLCRDIIESVNIVE